VSCDISAVRCLRSYRMAVAFYAAVTERFLEITASHFVFCVTDSDADRTTPK
jgi:hypothetical protein